MNEKDMRMFNKYIEDVFQAIQDTEFYNSNEKLKDYEQGMARLFAYFSETKEQEGQVFFIGNGGSSAIASHMTADYMKNGGMKTYSLYDNAVTTCMGNDYGYERIFSKPLEFLGRENDLLVAISSSGNSQNILNAVDISLKRGMRVITLSGFKRNNKLIMHGDFNIYVPLEHFGMVESIHNMILQQIVDCILERDGETL